MDKVTRIARRLAASAGDGCETWQVWSIDCWGNEQDGWDFNDRSRAWTFECDRKDAPEEYVQKCFEKSLRENGFRVVKFEYDWYDVDECQVNNYKTGEYLWQLEKIDGWY